ncbi:hypothetical protein IGI04_002886 [Brassica rapa subsp. trilocularis]|uniref:RNase H type-1 domain-containing protein n=1 Tax=Brassica rapa subsp. trilocularis TaxID=1813537 RepID=A0ABQ7P075_BRACM|nr:hypothetical protein IGI04_002886 [Brassica rapa subsp. trilocularis]
MPNVHNLASFEQAFDAFKGVTYLPPLGISVDLFPWICWNFGMVRKIVLFKILCLSIRNAAWNQCSKAAGCGWLFQNSNGFYIGQRLCLEQHVVSPFQAKALAVCSAMYNSKDFLRLRSMKNMYQIKLSNAY